MKLSPQKQALLEKLLREEGLAVTDQPVVSRRDGSNRCPMSFAQERLWFMDQLAPGSPFYNIPIAVQLEGHLHHEILDATLGELVQRHESLRTTFAQTDTSTVQVIHAGLIVPFRALDLTGADDPEGELYRLISEEAKQSFDLLHGPLCRATLLRMQDHLHVLLLTLHHIIADAWSLEILIREWTTLYGARRRGVSPSLPPLSLQYADFAVWQRRRLEGEEGTAQLAYWTTLLAGAPTVLNLSSNHSGSPVQYFEGSHERFEFSSDIVEALTRFNQREGATLFMTLLATFGVLVSRYSGQNDFLIGSPIANRQRTEFEDLIGILVNTLVLRLQLSGNPSFRELVARVREVCLNAFANQDTPFEKIVEALQPVRDASRTPLIQVAFVLQNAPTSELTVDGLTLRPLELSTDSAKFDLTWEVVETGQGLSGGVEFRSDLYESGTICRMINQFQVLLKTFMSDPSARIDEASLLDDAQTHRTLVEWNATHTPSPKDQTIPEVFERLVQRSPITVAVVDRDTSLTYGQLNRRANQLAHYLREMGIGPESRVGISLERSAELLVAVLGVLKAGGAYVALDVDYPVERREFMLADAGVTAVLTESSTAWTPRGTRVMDLDAIREQLLLKPMKNPVTITVPENMAYVIYTSGSTGHPKGVMIEHRSVVNLASWQAESFQITPHHRIAQFASFNFDGCVGETFMALLNGATLVIMGREYLDPARMAEGFTQHSIDVAVFVPSLLSRLDPHRVVSGRRPVVVSVGEVCPVGLASEWAAACRFRNGYGPTEYTVYSHLWEGDPSELARRETVPIGLPIHNTTSYILDSHLNLVPVGVVGELYLAGRGIARGYLNRPGMTAARFIPNPFIEMCRDLGDLRIDSALLAIERFRSNRDMLRAKAWQKSADWTLDLGIDAVDRLVQTFDEDLRERTSTFVHTHVGHDTYRAFCRYLLEGVHNNYASCGISTDVLRRLLPDGDIGGLNGVDLGCGNGEVLQALTEMGARVKGLDLNPYFAQQARRRGLDAQMVKVDDIWEQFSEGSGVDEGTQDFVICTLVLDRVEDPRQLLRNVFQLLKEEGCFAIQTILPINPIEDGDIDDPITYTSASLRLVPGKSASADKQRLVADLIKLGGCDISVQRIPYVVASRDGVQDYLLWSFTGRKDLKKAMNQLTDTRLYKTGDLCRYREDGSIEFVGRRDDQVKVRGFRVELGEIEAALQVVPSVREAVVLAREDNPGDKRLVAYVVAKPGTEPMEAGSLRSHLAQSLPEYMVPRAFMFLEQFPLTPNGKVDRKALPPPELTRGTLGYVAPRTPVEAQLAEVWADVLQVDKVGVEDNFFELGGHSLLATRLLSQVRTAFHVEMPLRTIFEAPTVEKFMRVLKQAQQEQREVLSGTELVPITRSGVMPVSYAQQRLWFLDQLEPGQAFYNIGGNVRLGGELDVPALTRTLNEIVRRHEVLRTTFTTIEGVPAQQIATNSNVAVPVVDLTGVPMGERERRAQRLAQEEAQMPFDLAVGPLLRIRVLRLAPTEHMLLFTMHHIVADGWSMSVLVQEVAALYSAFVQQRPSPLPELAIQYADYAAWQRQWMSGPLLQQQLAYWTEHLAGAPSILTLPTDRPRPSMHSYRGATQAFTVGTPTVMGLYQVGQQAQATLFMTLAAAFAVLLARYSGQRDICLGTPIANRTRAELEPLIGFFVNTLVLRTQIDPTQPFLTLLEQVRTTALNAYAHQDIPFEQVVEGLNPERQLSHTPLFQVMLILQNAPMDTLALPGLTLSALPAESTTAKFDLTVDLVEADGVLSGTVDYSTDLFEAATIARLVNHYVRLLEAIVAKPTARVNELSMLSHAERQQLLVEWNATATDAPATQTIQELFEAQVMRTPEAVAVVHEDRHLTYGELNVRANQLARYLRTLGVGPDVLVGLCVERSLDMLVGLLGILKAGGAYVPLDPTYPTERLAYMLADSRPQVLLTQSALRASLPATEIPTLCLDTQWERVATGTTVNLPHHTLPQHLAYVIYTSGSTGRPKGVAIMHRSATAFICWASTVYGIEELQGVLASTSIHFDLSVFELFVTLSCGGQVILSENALALSTLVKANDVTLINTVPSAIKELLRQNAIPNSVRTVNLAGESLQSAVVDQLYTLGGIQRVFDLYGPSEDTTYSTYMLRRLQGPATIGRPIANTQIYILDGDLEPVPVGVAGELHIAGEGLARGYLRRPDLTAEKFIPNPFSEEPGARMYRSGDLARYLPDGNIEYLGRMDHQVKIRGFRIELGEIEAALLAVPGVREAVVLAREDSLGDKRLVAYVVAEQNGSVESSGVRQRLAKVLPVYMVPAMFVFLEQFPLTPNGKVDRKALPPPESTRGTLGYVAPRTPVEAQLAEVWADVLQVDKVGVEDNFFELGGHSLLATRLLSQVRMAFHVEMPLRTIFEAPTISAFARLIEAIREGRPMTQDPPIDLAAEAVLPADVTPTGVNNQTIERAIRPVHVFLTGATGFLGAYLLRDLLEITRATIHCLVRATSSEEGRAKLRRNLETYGLWRESYQPRIEVRIGDLSHPLLGLSSDEFDQLAATMDVIFHNGARVDFTQAYSGLKAENVFGTQEILRLASQGRAKPVHYVSTVSVFDLETLPTGHIIREEDEIGPSAELQDGYSQSKWVAERLVQLAGRRGLPISIYRPGAVSGDSRTGAWKTNDFVCRMIKGCILLGKVPDLGGEVNLVPVDYVSRAIVTLSFKSHSFGNAFHLVNQHPRPLDEFVEHLQLRGYALEVVPEQQWRSELMANALGDSTNPLTPLLSIFENVDEAEPNSGQGDVRFDCRNTVDGLKETPVICPPLDAALIDTYFQYFEASGFLPAPSAACGHD